MTSQFLTEISTDTADADGTAAGSAVTTLEELNALFTSWVEVVYHRAVHTTTSQTPLQRWQAGWADRRPRHKDPEQIAEAFRWSAHRTVTRSGTVSLHANTYQVDHLLAGTRVELVYDPFDLTAPVTVTTATGLPAGDAVLLQISRHVHPKAARATADADTGAKHVSSGIDYLRLIETTHKESMTAQSITFTGLTDTPAPALDLQPELDLGLGLEPELDLGLGDRRADDEEAAS